MHIVVAVIAILFPNTSSAQDKIWSVKLLERYAAWERRRVRLPLVLELPLDQHSWPWFYGRKRTGVIFQPFEAGLHPSGEIPLRDYWHTDIYEDRDRY